MCACRTHTAIGWRVLVALSCESCQIGRPALQLLLLVAGTRSLSLSLASGIILLATVGWLVGWLVSNCSSRPCAAAGHTHGGAYIYICIAVCVPVVCVRGGAT